MEMVLIEMRRGFVDFLEAIKLEKNAANEGG